MRQFFSTVPQSMISPMSLFSLGEQIDNAKLMIKVLRTLPERFAMKVLTVTETHDLKKIKLDEVLGSLRIYEMNLKDKENESEKKTKGISLKAKGVSEDEKDFTEQIAYFAKNFGRLMRKLDRQGQQS